MQDLHLDISNEASSPLLLTGRQSRRRQPLSPVEHNVPKEIIQDAQSHSSAGHLPQSPNDSIDLYSILPRCLFDIVSSYQSPAEDLALRLALPAEKYKPDSKFALFLYCCHGNDNSDVQLSCFAKKSLYNNDTLILPTIRLNINENRDLSITNLNMLMNLPQGRLEQIDTLFVHLFDMNDKVKAKGEEYAVSLALVQLRCFIQHVTRVVVNLENQMVFSSYDDLGRGSHKFSFNLSACDDRMAVMSDVLCGLPYSRRGEIGLRAYLEKITQNETGMVVDDAMVLVNVHSLSVIHDDGHLSTVRWSFEGSEKRLSDVIKHRLSGLINMQEDITDLSQYPELCSLVVLGQVFTSPSFTHTSLRSLDYQSSSAEGALNLFAMHLPNLAHLSINDTAGHLHGPLLLHQYPQLIELTLHNISDRVTIDVGHASRMLSQLDLFRCHAALEGADHLWIESLCIDSTVSEQLLHTLHQRVASMEVVWYGPSTVLSNSVHLPAHLFSHTPHLKMVQRSLHTLSNPLSDAHGVFQLVSLTLVECHMDVSARVFPCLQTLVLLDGSVIYFLEDSENPQGLLYFPELQSLTMLSSTVKYIPVSKIHRQQRMVAAADHYALHTRSPVYFHAPQLKTLQLHHMVNQRQLLFSHTSCPRLEVIDWVSDREKSHCLPFDMNHPASLRFSHLRALCVNHTAPVNTVSLSVAAFPLSRVDVLQLHGHVWIPHLERLTLGCRYASVSSGILTNAAQQHQASLPIRTVVQQQLLSVMPCITLLLIDGVIVIDQPYPWTHSGTPLSEWMTDDRNDHLHYEPPRSTSLAMRCAPFLCSCSIM